DRQDIYRIPTQVHWVGTTLGRPLRLALGLGWLGAIYGLYALLRLLPSQWSPTLIGPIAGLTLGTAPAIGGRSKDGSGTRLYMRQFVRSPINGAIGGLIVSLHAGGLRFFVLGAIACERMLTELFFKVLRPGYVGGHFKSTEPAFPEWMSRRRIFVAPYVL